MTTKYGLNIVFYMKTYAQFDLYESYEFNLNNLDFQLKKLNDLDKSYSLIVKPIDDMNHAQTILNYVKLALTLFVLDYHWVAFEIDENIETANMSENPIKFKNNIHHGDFDINRTTLFPLDKKLIVCESHPIPIINYLKEDDLKNSIDLSFTLNSEKILKNEKLVLALEIYSRLSQHSRKTQFLDLVTILEILKPDYPVSDESMQSINDIKNEIKKHRNSFEKDSEEYQEFERYFTSISFWSMKSINQSLQLFAKEHENEFREYENIDLKIKNAYSIRSNIVHNGVIDEDFDEYYNFLIGFVGKMLKIIIFENEE